jgi:transcription-repair coupling factor (superfamily II helicase)
MEYLRTPAGGLRLRFQGAFVNLQFLLEKYLEDPRVKRIAEGIVVPGKRAIRLEGLCGSSAEVLFSAVYSHPSAASCNHLVILNDAEEAAYFHNSVENLIRPIDLFFYPSSFPRTPKPSSRR